MKVIAYPAKETWAELLQRPVGNNDTIKDAVQQILDDVRTKGDAAIKEYNARFDGYTGQQLKVAPEEWELADTISMELKTAIDVAIKNITAFHAAQKEEVRKIETMPGITCWRKSVAIEKVGLYIPGGTAPLFSTLLMLAIPARLAGCKDIIVCTPPDSDGRIHPAILYAARKCGLETVYKMGGVQAIAAMAYGTETVPQVYKIFGPGNSYVTCAKMLLNAQGIAIDMPAGPSEVAILADDSCIVEYVAADLLSQAEHGSDSQVVLVSDSKMVIDNVNKALQKQLEALQRKEIATKALTNSKVILVASLDEGVQLLNAYAPEHLILACRNDENVAEQVINAGSVFLGNYSPESAGDYLSGTNHTLPTNGYAKAYSGVSLDSFVKKITFQKLTKEGVQAIASHVAAMAMAEGLDAHAKSITIRSTPIQ